jgi:hypothetical protein
VHAILDDQLEANRQAAQEGGGEDWLAYRFLVGWLGARFVLEAIEEAERQGGLGRKRRLWVTDGDQSP